MGLGIQPRIESCQAFQLLAPVELHYVAEHTPSTLFREAKDTISRLTEGGAEVAKTVEDEEIPQHELVEEEEEKVAEEDDTNMEAEEGHGEKRKLTENSEGWLTTL